MEVRGTGEFLNDSHGATGKVTEIGRIEIRDCTVDSCNSCVLYLPSGKTSSKSFEQHELPLADGISALLAVSVLVLWQHVDRVSASPTKTF